jgi:hypothetical protein
MMLGQRKEDSEHIVGDRLELTLRSGIEVWPFILEGREFDKSIILSSTRRIEMSRYRSIIVLTLLLLVILTLTRFVQAEAASTASAQTGVQNVGMAQAQKAEQLNAFARELRASISAQALTTSTSYASYTKVSDDLDRISMEIPSAWNDIDTGRWLYHGKDVGQFIAASADLQNFYSTKKEPGVFLGASHQLVHTYGAAGLLDSEKKSLSSKCKVKERKAYQDLFYTGSYDTYVECLKGNHNLIVAAATTPDHRVAILLRITVASNADLDAAAIIFKTFQVLGNPEIHDDHDDH